MNSQPTDRAWIWPLLMAATITLASGQTRLATPDIGFTLSKDKLGHFFVFGLLATALLRTDPLRRKAWVGTVLAGLLTSLFGLFDELRQSLTPGRAVEFADWLADTAGACTAVTVYKVWPAYRRLLERQVPTWPMARDTGRNASSGNLTETTPPGATVKPPRRSARRE